MLLLYNEKISVSIYGIGHRYENKNAKVIVTK